MQIKSKYLLINNKKSLELALVSLKSAKSLSVDTESSGYFTYFSRVCLIQINASGQNFIFDPLSNIDLGPLGEVFSDDKILKIFHSAPDDIKVLKRDFSFQFKNIADTMYSSKLLGLEHNSLHFLVQNYHGIELSKTQQKSNWEYRPLQEKQLVYAALDTVYLESIWEKMREALEKENLLEEAYSEFERMTVEEYSLREDNQEVQLHRFPEIQKYSPEERRLILNILQFREEKAKRMNKASFRVMNNEYIVKIVQKKPTEEELIEKLGKKDGKALFEEIQNPKGELIETISIPRVNADLNPEEEVIFQRLKKWRDKVMKHRNIDHSMLLSNKNLISVLQKNPQNIQELENMNLMSDWKLKNYGPMLLKALKNEPYEYLLKKMTVIKGKKKKKTKGHFLQKKKRIRRDKSEGKKWNR